MTAKKLFWKTSLLPVWTFQKCVYPSDFTWNQLLVDFWQINSISELISRKISGVAKLFPHCVTCSLPLNTLFRNKIFMKRATTIYLAKAVFSTYPEALTCQVNETYSTFHFENMEATSNFDFFLKRRHINPCKNNSNFDLVKNFVKSTTLYWNGELFARCCWPSDEFLH